VAILGKQPAYYGHHEHWYWTAYASFIQTNIQTNFATCRKQRLVASICMQNSENGEHMWIIIELYIEKVAIIGLLALSMKDHLHLL